MGGGRIWGGLRKEFVNCVFEGLNSSFKFSILSAKSVFGGGAGRRKRGERVLSSSGILTGNAGPAHLGFRGW